ncbi:katanin p80 WD40 repeat-containing subunit B1 homolog isoform X1 [Punica granatum]|uniref:Katanin p80 WD40 repeat-containing subunit B1 homolog n=1 Tax=Punica granatum TaxID=22663 RepID=A0A6P8DFZ6_PUNGR|nr:katanin p80 WD40 repeat-containing subunit B1 homolog isoform X1 [Punica granatum]
MAKRGYKLQEFVAHSGNVNCLSIGKKARRLFLTGGEDNKVNLWAIGKPNSLMSLCGHTSPVESVAFDSAETLVLGGASSGVIKLWDLEEAKMVRGLTGHRSNCTSVEFHPFGEFFASGSMDTNLKIWDIRKKGCIHTYKGHTRSISTIRFTPDGRWVVSGGYDNIVKVWDLTAGKLLHDFKFHENHIRSIDFHPLEFLLATGSADRTVKFWDLETFELIGSTRPEATGVRSITFHPDGRTLFCGLDDSLKVYSWEPVICHDSIDMGWSTLSDLCIHEGKLLGCSYYQNSVGVWVSDISLIEPYGANLVPPQKDVMQHEFNLQKSHSVKKGSDERSISSLRCPSPDYETKEIKNIYVDTANGNPVCSERVGSLSSPKIILPLDSPDIGSPMVKKHTSSAKGSPEKAREQAFLKSFSVPDVALQESAEGKDSSVPRKESITFSRTKPGMLLKPAHRRRPSTTKLDAEGLSLTAEMKNISETKSISDSSDPMLPKLTAHRRRLSSTRFDVETLSDSSESRTFSETKVDFNGPLDTGIKIAPGTPKESPQEDCSDIKNVPEKIDKTLPQTPKDENRDESLCSRQGITPVKIVNGVAVVPGRTRTLVEKFERREILNSAEEQTTATPPQELPATDKANTSVPMSFERKETVSSSSNQSTDSSPSLISARSQTPATSVCSSESREEMLKSTEDQETSRLIPCMEPSRSKTPPIPNSSIDKRERHNSKEDQETAVSHNVVVLARDKAPSSQVDAFVRRERLSIKEDREATAVPNVVLGKDRTPTCRVGSSERRQRLNKEDQSASIISPNVALGRDKVPPNQVGRFERRERFNSKEDQPTRISSRIAPSRERTPPSLGGSIQRRERLSSPEDQAANRVLPVMERTTAAAGSFEERERFNSTMEDQESNIPLRTVSVIDKMATTQMGESQILGREPDSADDRDVAEVLMESHEVFLSTLRSRLTKLQVIRHFFERNDMKGAINAMRKLPDHSVQADVVGILMEKMDMLNLDLFSSLLPVLVSLLDSKIERHTSLSLEMLLKLVAVFGSLVFATVSAPPTVGVDLHAEQRRECCNQCFAQLQKIQKILPLLVRRGGVVARCAQELNLVLQQS